LAKRTLNQLSVSQKPKDENSRLICDFNNAVKKRGSH